MGFWRGVRRKAGLALPGLAALLAVALLQQLGALDRIGLLLFDAWQRAAPRPYEDAAVRVVDIDDETIRRLGQWPWPRTDIARLTQRLADAGAAVIAYDIVFSEPDRTSPARVADRLAGATPELALTLRSLPDNDRLLAGTLSGAPVVLGYFLGNEGRGATVEPKAGVALAGSPPNAWKQRFTSATQPIAPLREAAAGLGFVSRVGDDDGVVRQAPLVLPQNDQLLPSLTLEALRVAQQAGSVIVKTSDASGELAGDGRVEVAAVKVGDFEAPTTPQGDLWAWYTRPQPDRVVPAWQVLAGALSDAQMRAKFEGHVVFVGAGAAGLRDLVSTPVAERELGVMVHAQAAEQIILRKFLVRPYWARAAELGLLLGLGLVLAAALPFLGAMRGAVLGAVMIGGVAAGSWLAYRNAQFLLDPTYPALGLLGAYVLITGVTYWREERQRAYIHRAFDRYLSPELVKRIADDPARLRLGGEERHMTVLFADIRGFSRISEKLSPQEIIRFLVAFLTPMTDLLLARKATIDKYIGDAILAFWNAPLDDPDQHANAARAALEMIARLDRLNAEMPGSGEPWPGEVKIGIGMDSGPCCVGNMGSAQRLSYSLIGDTVNLASRLEGLTKYYGVPIVLGEGLAAELTAFAVVPIDRVRVVGREAPETVSALLGDEALAASEDFRAFAASHGAMLRAYRAREWDAAEALLDAQGAAAEGYGLGRLHALLRERIARYRASPPDEDWDGVFEATEK